MSEIINLSEINEHKELLELLYDSYRLVDPEKKKVIEYHRGSTAETAESCFSRWGRSHPCENCVSYHSLQKSKSIVKLFANSGCIVIVRAMPVESEERPLVLELIKDITDSLVYDSGAGPDSQYIINAVSDLDNMVVKDHLTLLYNRRYLDDRLPVELKNSAAQKTPLSVVFIDVDDFKHINDTYGHDTGDIVLKAVAESIKGCIRNESDWVARYGGDEFFVCLNGADESAALETANRILGAVDGISVPVKDGNISITVSIGIHTMSNQEQSAANMLKTADNNMYKSKHCGKNCITSSSI
ncbi:MAG: GGDEF domain-containing protein [Clostridiales bacterium]|nr:GGDEF domain-containing protein [Clostridiales bacterium]